MRMRGGVGWFCGGCAGTPKSDPYESPHSTRPPANVGMGEAHYAHAPEPACTIQTSSPHPQPPVLRVMAGRDRECASLSDFLADVPGDAARRCLRATAPREVVPAPRALRVRRRAAHHRDPRGGPVRAAVLGSASLAASSVNRLHAARGLTPQPSPAQLTASKPPPPPPSPPKAPPPAPAPHPTPATDARAESAPCIRRARCGPGTAGPRTPSGPPDPARLSA